MEGMGTWDSNQPSDCRVHSFQADRTCGKLEHVGVRNGLGHGVFNIDDD